MGITKKRAYYKGLNLCFLLVLFPGILALGYFAGATNMDTETAGTVGILYIALVHILGWVSLYAWAKYKGRGRGLPVLIFLSIPGYLIGAFLLSRMPGKPLQKPQETHPGEAAPLPDTVVQRVSTGNNFCIACGAALPRGARFCESCGKEVALPTQLERQASMPKAVSPVAEEDGAIYNVILKGIGANKISVIRTVQALTSLGLKESKDLVEGTPTLIMEGVTRDEAAAAKLKLEKAGATVEVILSPGFKTQPSTLEVGTRKTHPKHQSTRVKQSAKSSVAGMLFALTFSFFILSFFGLLLSEIFVSVTIPHPYYNGSSRTVLLSNPSFNGRTAEVSPRELQKTIDGYSYGRLYQAGVFDCSDMSIALARYLEQQGYDTSVIGDDVCAHAWVYVWTGKNRAWAIEATATALDPRGGGGEIIGDEWWDVFSTLNGFSGFLDLLEYGNAYELYYPTHSRSGIVTLEWSEVGPGR